MIRDGEAVSGDPRDPDSGQCSGGTGRGWRSLGPLLSLWEPPLLPCSPPRLSVSCRPGEWEKAERPRAGDGANSLVTPQQELGARGASVIHQRDCPLPACVGRDASTFYLYPPRRTWWEAEVQHRARARKGWRKERAGPRAPEPGRSAGGAGEEGMWRLPAQAEPGRAAWCWGASSKHVVRGAAGLPPPQRMFPQGASVCGAAGGGGALSLTHQLGWVFLREDLPKEQKGELPGGLGEAWKE